MKSLHGLVVIAIASILCPHPTLCQAQTADNRPITILGTLVDAEGQPAADVTVRVASGRGDEQVTTTTDSKGAFTITSTHFNLRGNAIEAVTDSGKRQARALLDYEAQALEKASPLELKLAAATPINVIVRNESGATVSDATVIASDDRFANRIANTDAKGRCELWVLETEKIRSIAAIKNGMGLDYRSFEKPRDAYNDLTYEAPKVSVDEALVLTLGESSPITLKIVDSKGVPIEGVQLSPWYFEKESETRDLNIDYSGTGLKQLTDAQGKATFDWIPSWNEKQIVFWPRCAGYVRTRIIYNPTEHDGELKSVMRGLVPISGIVSDQQGNPVQGATIRVAGEGYSHDDFRGSVLSGDDGSYKIEVNPDHVYVMVAGKGALQSSPQTGFKAVEGESITGKDFVIRRGTRIHGRVTEGADKKPVVGFRVNSYQYGADANNTPGLELPNPENNRTWIQPMLVSSATTDANGDYEFFVGPGDHDIRGQSPDDYERFEVTEQSDINFDFHRDRPKEIILTGKVIDGETGKPVADVTVASIYQASIGRTNPSFRTDETGQFKGMRETYPMVLHATNSDGTKAAVVSIDATTESAEISLAPLGRATGIVLDGGKGLTMPDAEIRYGVRVYVDAVDSGPFSVRFGGTTTSDAEGKFTLNNLIIGQEYDVSFVNRGEKGEVISWSTLMSFTPEDIETVDLGEVTKRAAYKPQTLDERIAKAFATKDDETTSDRIAAKTRVAKRVTQHVLVLSGSPEDSTTREFLKLRYDDRPTRTALFDYAVLATDDADEFPQTGGGFAITILDVDGNTLAEADSDVFLTDNKVDSEKLIAFLDLNKPPVLDARKLLADALAKAKSENKRVLIQESATWCGPCHMLSELLIDRRELWEQDYIWVKLDHRWTDAREIGKEYRKGEHTGIPWWAILDDEGSLLISSNDEKGDNIGFPSNDRGRQHFRKMIESTRIRLTDEQLDALVAK